MDKNTNQFIALSQDNLNQPIVKGMFLQEVINIYSGQWNDDKVNKTIKHIKEWKCQKIYACHNNRPQILKDIYQVNFSQLKLLNIWGNNIKSVQSLTRIRLPSLIELLISNCVSDKDNNQIMQLRQIRKAIWNDLQRISTQNNFVHSYIFLAEIRLRNCQRLDITKNGSINCIAKMETERIEVCQAFEGCQRKLKSLCYLQNALRKKLKKQIVYVSL